MSLNIDYKRINVICLLEKMGVAVGVQQIGKVMNLLQLNRKNKKKDGSGEGVDGEK